VPSRLERYQRSYRALADELAAELATVGFISPGSVVSRYTSCGKPGCRCQADPPMLHGPYLTWTRTVNGKTVTRKVTEDQKAHYQAWFDNARRLRQLVTDLETLSLEAFKPEGDPSHRR